MTRFINAAVCATALALCSVSAIAIDLSNNLSNVTFSVETATPTRLLAANFGTGPAAHTLNSVALLLSSNSGAATVSIHADGGLEPGALIATLTSPAAYSTVLTPTVFTTAGLALAANTTYWIVLRPQSGAFNWGWSADNSGSGVGFLHQWGSSDDGGAFWWTIDSYATQFSVTVDSCTGPSISASPSSLIGCIGGAASFSAAGNGSGTLNHRWRYNGTPLTDSLNVTGSGTPTLSLTGLTMGQAGAYDCQITNACGNAVTTEAVLTLCSADFNCDGGVDGGDIEAFFRSWADGLAVADVNADGGVDGQDAATFFASWESGGC